MKRLSCLSCSKEMIAFLALLVGLLPTVAFGAMDKYCQTPPYIVGGATPNLLLMFDNSASMYDTAYISSTGAYCYDNTYDNTKSYEGYFTQTEVYSYSGGKFSPGSSIPSSCTYGNNFFCANLTGSGTTRAVSSFIASGRFLNWLATSKFDIQKKVLTGGNFDPVSNMLLGEARGCVGRRFVKEVPSVPGITFALRGPSQQEDNLWRPDVQGGQSRIEIYEVNYDEVACQSAITNWISGNYGQASIDTKQCIGAGAPNTPLGVELSTFNHSLQTCWLIKDNIKRGRDMWQGVNTQDLEVACTLAYAKDGKLPAEYTNDSNGNYICTSVATHILPGSPFDSLGADIEGFIGKCWQGPAGKFAGNEACVKREILHYCYGVDITEVADPSEGVSSTTETWNIPAVVTDAGLRAGGDPLPPAGSANRYFLVKVAASAPQGVIQEFNGRIRFGAMSFNPLGNVSECNQSGASMKCPSNLKVCSVSTTMQCTVNTDCPAGETCVAAQNLDGAKVIHYIRNVCSATTGTECKVNADCPANETCVSPVGDHTSGLVKAINDVRAGTWTPYAEAFYNAIGYFARTNDYTVSPGLSSNLRINATDFVLNKNPSQYPCQRNNILVISDGMSTADLNANVNTLVSQYNDGDGQYDTSIGVCPKFGGSRNLDDIAWLAWNKNITDFSDAMTTEEKKDPRNHSKYIKTYVVYTGSADTDPGECSAETLMRQTGTNGCGTGTECYQRAENYDQLVAALKRVLQDLAAPASGTASSVLASSQGSGANLLQAIFFPMDKRFDREVAWTGEMQNLWYFLDPELEAETIREDSNENKEFELSSDRVIRFFFDNSVARTRVDRAGTTVEIEDIKDIWKVGEKLWGTDPASRTIYTWAGGAPSLMSFSTGSASTLRPYLQAADDTEAGETIRYVRGEDLPNFCSVTTTKQCVSNNDCPSETCIIKNRMRAVKIGGIEKTWKLGDIVSSTPKQQTSIPLNSYHLSPPSGYADTTYEEFINGDAYKARGMVYVGANDGMLHAFRFGVLEQINDPDQPEKKAKLTGTDLGKEEWAYVPRNALPYLKYLRDPSYCHLNFVDAAPYIFDASIGGAAGGTKEKGSWRTILIGGMGLGGACRKDGVCSKTTTQSCNTDAQCPVNEQCLCVGNCVTTPRLDPDNASQGLGYSSYFAFDVTDPTNPVLLWEFSDPRLGFSTSGPAIVRIGGKDENGQWYAVFGSGPTGPIDLAHYQFLGNSDQRMRLFVLDLRTGSLVGQPLDTGIDDGFAGSLINATVDTDRWSGTSGGFYKDDALYFGYTKKANDGTWTDGGILRVLTKESSPGSWEVGHVLRDTGPVTAAISKLQDRKKGREALWLYFGGGRYFYKSDVTIDDPTNRRRLYGVKEPCYTAATNDIDQSCNAEAGGLVNQTTSPSETLNASAGGWQIELDGESADGIYKSERILTDPLAAFNGAVFFVSVMPSADVCGFGGQTYLWAVRYNTGGRAPSDSLQGSALVQVSTGSIEQIKLATAITDDAAHKEGRRTAPGTFGVPPRGPGLTVVVNPRPVKRVLHIQEK